MNKLEILTEIEGYDNTMDMLEHVAADSVVPGICMTEGCNYVTQVYPDCDDAWCELCDTQTVQSCLILAEWV